MSTYGWIITEENRDLAGRTRWESTGPVVVGPRGLDPEVERRLLDGEGQEFVMHYDDPMPALRGRAIGCEGWEPLYDFGMPSHGATAITWPDDPGMDCG